jgi:hypothetical protein
LVNADNRYGWFGQYWIDYFDASDAPDLIRGDRNYNVNIESTLQRLAVFYRLQNTTSDSELSLSPIPKVIVEFSAKVGQKDALNTRVAPKGVTVKRFNNGSAIQFIKTHYPAYYKTWRLTRSEADKQHLFALCYLVIFGGVYIADSRSLKPNNKLSTLWLPNSTLLLAKGYMGITTEFVATKPNHPLLAAMLYYVSATINNRSRLPSPYTTGALSWAKTYCEYRQKLQERGIEPDVTLLSEHRLSNIIGT